MTGSVGNENTGVNIGSISGGKFAGVGAGATGNIYEGSQPAQELAELRRRLEELQELVERNAAELDDSDAARDAVAEAQTEARSGNPEPRKLRMLLSAITGAASSVSAVTTAASGIRALLDGLG
jgi:hypothetical protein